MKPPPSYEFYSYFQEISKKPFTNMKSAHIMGVTMDIGRIITTMAVYNTPFLIREAKNEQNMRTAQAE